MPTMKKKRKLGKEDIPTLEGLVLVLLRNDFATFREAFYIFLSFRFGICLSLR